MAYYRRPGWFTTNVFNPAVAALTRAGLSVWGSRILRVRGRTSGEWRSAPVNLLTYEGKRYLVAPRGLTQWVRNLRVAKAGDLLLGNNMEPFRAVEVSDEEKVPILRAYLKRWTAEVGIFFQGVGPDSPVEEIRRIAPDHPVSESIRGPLLPVLWLARFQGLPPFDPGALKVGLGGFGGERPHRLLDSRRELA